MPAKTEYIVPMAILGCFMVFASALMVLIGQNLIGNILMMVGGLCIVLTIIFTFEMPLVPPKGPVQPLIE